MDKDDVDQLNSDGEYESDDENTNTFRIRNPVNPPSAKIFSTRELHALIHEGLIDLDPPYQRDVVWPESKQIGLIDSIFRNFYIPPVIFAITKDQDGEEVRVCVDGKQRLTSIQKFFDGQIPHRDTKAKLNYWFTRPESFKGKRLDIPEHWKAQFCEKQITCVEYHGLATGTEREIFQRVQMGMTLTAAEKLQAIPSAWAEWVSDLEVRYVSADNGLASHLQWDTRRGRDFQCIAQVVYLCDGLPAQHIPSAQSLERWISRADPPTPAFKHTMDEVFRAFWQFASDVRYNYGFKQIEKKLAPVEFVFVGVLLYMTRTASMEERANAIYKMRTHVRQMHRDVRTNNVCCKTLWAFMDDLDDMELDSATIAGKKRKKGPGDHPDEHDYHPSPTRTLGAAPKTRSKVPRKA